MAIFFIQILFLFVTLSSLKVEIILVRPTEVHILFFFTVLKMHLSCITKAQNGLNMMKYSLIHSNEFTHPISGFIIGFISFTLVIIIECLNLLTI